MPVIPIHEYQQARNDYQGWCLNCQSFTRECTEPDAADYDCPDCDEHSVYGAEEALMLGFIEVGGDQ
jgi:Zn finger protein HypA/HybF involved in hydrogenase expression